MPFGTKHDSEGNEVNFDEIYKDLIKPPIIELGIECIRCDEISKAGMIHKDMFNNIYNADIAVVDISILNPNVFYELGMRHSLKKSITVLLKRKHTQIPFNITGMRLIEYDETNVDSIEQAKLEIRKFVENGMHERQIDSPVFDAIEDLVVQTTEKVITKSEVFEYKIKKDSLKIIGIRTGNIDKVKDVDIWVNSENTNMQMDSYYSGSISGMIRYLGAKKDITKNILEDTIQNELEQILGQHSSVNPGVVLPTGAGDLEKTHNVKKIFHAASAIGNIGKGYSPVTEIERCINEAMSLTESFANLKSIIFPFLGLGRSKSDVEFIVPKLINTVIDYFEENPECSIEKVFFITRFVSVFDLANFYLSKMQLD